MKMNWKKKMALLLAAAMLFSALPAAAPADGASVVSEWHGAGGATLLYTVTFMVNGRQYGSPFQGTALTLPDDPYLEGHDFVAWQDESGNALRDGMALTSSLTATAVFRKIETVRVQVAYVLENGASAGTAHEATLALRDYASADYVVESPAKVQVNGAEYLPDLPRVRITHEDMAAAWAGNGLISRRVVYAPADLSYTLISKVGELTAATEQKTGRFGSRASVPEETAFGYLSSIENDVLTEQGQTVTAHYSSRRFTLSLDTAGGEAMASVTGDYGAQVDLSRLTPAARTGYSFDGWRDENGLTVTGPLLLTENRKLTAAWAPADTTYTIVYYKQAFSSDALVYEFDKSEIKTAVTGSQIALDGAPLSAIDNASFYTLNQSATAPVTVASDGTSVLNVYYDLNEYTLTFDANGGAFTDGDTIKTIAVRLNQPIAAQWPTAVWEGRQFNGWAGAANYMTKQVTVTAAMLSRTTLTAQWTEPGSAVEVNYYLENAQGDYERSEDLSQTIPYTNSLSAKSIAGYTVNSQRSVLENNVYHFYYDRETFHFIYHEDGQTRESSGVRFEASTAAMNAAPVSANGREFAGWYADAGLKSPYVFTIMPSHNVDLYAGWKNPTVTFVTDEGRVERTVVYGQAVPAPAEPVKQYHTFSGWYTEQGGKYDFSSPVKTDLTLTARFTLNELAYTVRYVDGNGAALAVAKRVADASLAVGAAVTEKAPAIAGYLPDRAAAALTLAMDSAQNVITFIYSAAPDTVQYIVKYVDKAGRAVHAAAVKSVPGSTAVVQENAVPVEGLYPQRGAQSLTLTSGANELTFVYAGYQTSHVTVQYLDMDGAALPGQAEGSLLLRLAESADVSKAISGYTFDHAQGDTLYIIDSQSIGGDFTTRLYYRKNLTAQPRSLQKTYDGAALSPDGVADLTVTGLKSGHRIAAVTYEGSRTEPGTGESRVTSLTIAGPASGNDYYAVTLLPGTLTVTEKPAVKPTATPKTRKTMMKSAPALRNANSTLATGSTITLDNGLTLTADSDVEYKLENGVLTILSGNVTLSGETTDSVVIAGDSTVTLAGVTITPSSNAPAIKIGVDSKATVTLADGTENTLTGKGNYAALAVAWASGSEYGDLTINGNGTLIATATGSGAGIGGSKADQGIYGNITINSGTIVATGNGRSAGIGSSDNPNDGASHGSYKYSNEPWGTITINGGDITAVGNGNGAGIGGGNHTDSGTIIINDGTIHATGETGIGSGLGSSSGADKGPGYYCAYVTINGGDITAYGTDNMGSGIGGGMYSDAYVTITGGTINASVKKGGNPYQGGAGIGGGYQGVGVVVITGGEITAAGANGAPGIGNGALAATTTTKNLVDGVATGTKNVRTGKPTIAGEDSKVEISGGTIVATGGEGAAGIGTGNCSEWCNVTISGGDVTAIGGASESSTQEGIYEGGAGIGSGASSVQNKLAYEKETNVNISITGGNVVAIGAWGAAGIGSGAKNRMADQISISDVADVQAYSDGTKFAIDTREDSDGVTTSRTEGRTINGTVLQGTYMFPWDATSGTQDARGLSPIVIVNEETGETKTLAGIIPEGYRSFATSVDGAGVYTVYTQGVEAIASGSQAYFSVSSAEGEAPDNKNNDMIQMTVEENKLSDNFFLYPVKTIIVEKEVSAPSGIKNGLSYTITFSLLDANKNKTGFADQSITLKNGVPQNKAYFVNVPEGSYNVWENASVGDAVAGGKAVIVKIATRKSSGATTNNGTISATQWVDDVTVVNTYGENIPETVDVAGVKTWVDDNNRDGVRPNAIQINLLANGSQADSVTVTAADSWAWSFTGLPKYQNGKEIVYTITENPVTGYATMVNGYNVTNTHTSERIEISGRKTWVDNDDQDGLRPESITVNLLANGTHVQSKTVTAADGWAYTFSNLFRYQNGREIAYTITEDSVAEYTAQISGYNITNTHTPETVSVSGDKTWIDQNDQDGIRPESITVHLLSDGVRVDSRTVSGTGDRWSFSFENLPKYQNGREIVYTVSENDVAGYTAQISGFSIINTHESHAIDVNGTKTWVDYGDKDGIRPAGITVRLLADGQEVRSQTVAGSGDQWNYRFTGLPQYANGKEIAYTVTEDAVPGYTTTVAGMNIFNMHKPEDEVEPVRFTLTVRYWADGRQAFPTFFATYDYGSEYNVVSPTLPGYTVDLAAVIGVIYQDTVVDVYYTPAEVHLTIYYQYLDGTAAADTHYETLHAGDAYDVVSPVIEGYVASILRVEGVMPGRDVEYVVIYVAQPKDKKKQPKDDDKKIFLHAYETPLGLGNVNLNAGECFE